MDFWRWLAFPMGVLLCCDLQTSAVQKPASHNCTSDGQRISFSHSYKIDLPMSSQIKVEADPLQHEDNSGVQLDPGKAMENEEQNIIFRHNIHVRAPKGDCETLTHIKGLFERIEKLEKEVAELREVCSPHKCCGGSQGISHCSSHGTFLYETCSCKCAEGWEGSDCSHPTCPSHCSGHGRCDSGKCICDEPYFGEDCSHQLCPENCSGNGICDTAKGVCQCYEEFIGEDCSEKRCPEDCSGNGFCDTGECYCHDGFFGLDCSQVLSALSAIWVTEEMEHSLEVEWENPRTDVDYYKLKFRSLVGMDEKQVMVPKSNEPKSRHVMTGLKPGTEYEVTVIPMKDDTEGKPSSVSGRTGVDSPTNVATDRVTEDTATVSWSKVEAPIDRYMVRYTSADGDIKEIEVGSENDIITLLDLKPGMEYVIHIWAEKGPQQSKTASIRAVTEIDSPTELLTDQVTEDAITVSWNKVQASIDRYRVSYTSASGITEEREVEKDKNVTTLAGLKPGMEYVIYIWAEKGEQQSKRASTEAVTKIDSPAHLVTDQVTEDTAIISWDRVQALIDRYMVNYTSVDDDTEEMEVGKNETTMTLTGLKPGIEYVIFLWAEKRTRQSKRLSTEAVTEIDPPKNLRVSDVTHSTGVVTWTPPAAQIDGYALTYQGQDGTSKEVQLGPSEQRFVLEGLEQGVRYTIFVMAYKGDRQSRKTDSTFSTVSFLYPYPADCSQVQQNGNASSGMYTIYLNGDGSRPMQVYCDMTTDGGGWIVFQRRSTGEVDFYKRWKNYVEGFGDPTGEFWLGLDKLHNLTSSSPIRYELRVDLRTAGESVYAVYDFFQVASSRDRYRLSVGNYRGNAGDAMTYHNGWKFTTWDRDNDVALSNYALTHHGAWWYKNCHLANLNGKYGDSKHSEGVNWEPWKGHEFSIPFTEMKIRPQSPSNEPILERKKRSLPGKRKAISLKKSLRRHAVN
ncbi:tenascin-N isoform X4 [Accipiter gentilis]|uniref:tenascin-N isoform X4 n=1 Tax=Astur gentilis TaxID=8957 RepID=UPI00210FEAED|nr:tenascin-N isoform X4 [Accipiter gentilis]